MDFQTLIKCLIELVLGALVITFAVNDYSHKRYFNFGLNVMFAVAFAATMIRMMFTP